MLAIRPVTYEVETSLSPKRVLRKLDGDLIEHRPTINILSQSKFMKTTVTIPFFMATAQTPKAFRYSTTPPKSVTEAQQAFMAR